MYTLSCIGEKKAKLKELSNNISDRSEAKGTGILSDLLLVNGEARQLVANPQYTILFLLINFGVINILWISARPPSRGQWYHGLIELEVTFLKILQYSQH